MRRLTKRTLVAVSHGIERAALARSDDVPMVVIALFQAGDYFERQKDVYNTIAARSAATVVAGVGIQAGDTPNGLSMVDLAPAERLAHDWAVVVLTPRFGAGLFAVEQDPGSGVPDNRRVFQGEWHVRRDEALRQVVRLRHDLRSKLSRHTARAIDDVVERIRQMPAQQGEARIDAMIDALTDALSERVEPPSGEHAGSDRFDHAR